MGYGDGEFIEKGTVNKQIFNKDVPTAPPLNIFSEDAHKDVERSLTSRSNVTSSAADAKVSSITKEEDILRNTVFDIGTQSNNGNEISENLRGLPSIIAESAVSFPARLPTFRAIGQGLWCAVISYDACIISGEAARKPKISIGKMKLQVRKIKMAFDPPSGCSSLSLKFPIVKVGSVQYRFSDLLSTLCSRFKGLQNAHMIPQILREGDRVRESQMDCSAEQGEVKNRSACVVVMDCNKCVPSPSLVQGADLSDADLRGADFSLANVTKVVERGQLLKLPFTTTFDYFQSFLTDVAVNCTINEKSQATRSHVWSHFCLCFQGHKLINNEDHILLYGIRDGCMEYVMAVSFFDISIENGIREAVKLSTVTNVGLIELIEIRRSSYHDVVRVAEIPKVLDIVGV
ncbi:hypothetical protein Syun_010250 [Stephania yunnanensis]|uniref:SNRNP25 ubiquitin-like domain-containing protein n=1 Tax=Stephania yunnanensis TaxID=152371 RepID=A0AAP0KG33_9MAGN